MSQITLNNSITIPVDAPVVDNAPTFEQSGGNYQFYDKRKATRMPNAYEKLLAKAQRSIWVWDPYMDSDTFPELFKDVEAKSMRVEILTTLYPGKSKSDLQNLTTGIKNVLPSPCTVVGKAYYRVDWHDRYLIIDESKVYLVGASMDAHADTGKSYGICQLTDSRDIEFVIRKYKEYRDNTVPNNRKESDTARK